MLTRDAPKKLTGSPQNVAFKLPVIKKSAAAQKCLLGKELASQKKELNSSKMHNLLQMCTGNFLESMQTLF